MPFELSMLNLITPIGKFHLRPGGTSISTPLAAGVVALLHAAWSYRHRYQSLNQTAYESDYIYPLLEIYPTELYEALKKSVERYQYSSIFITQITLNSNLEINSARMIDRSFRIGWGAIDVYDAARIILES
ncbi:MAG: hypothetical protein HeimC2_10310 [Candidatus Heimdallarchaeota archaeon LC_2]|nr:MAG: hypothetical protein HeimC2_10310 [Candidatus Heimdallarchaeota archaeon LC_2]